MEIPLLECLQSLRWPKCLLVTPHPQAHTDTPAQTHTPSCACVTIATAATLCRHICVLAPLCERAIEKTVLSAAISISLFSVLTVSWSLL